MKNLDKLNRARPRTGERYLLAALCIIAPLVVYLVGFWWLGLNYFFPSSLSASDFQVELIQDSTQVFSLELAPRERVFLTSIAVSVMSIVATIYAIATIERNRGWRPTLLILAVCLSLGTIAATHQGNPIRDMVVEWPLGQAAFNYISYGLPELYDGMRLFSVINSFCALTAASALVARFVDLTLGDGRWDGENDIPTRGLALRQTILCAGVLLTLATVATYFYYHYPLVLMEEGSAQVHRRFSEMASIRWGAIYSSVMITASAPAIAAHSLERQRLARDLQRYAKEEPGLEIPTPPPWVPLQTLALLGKAALAVAAMLAPAAVSPILEFFNAGAQ